MKHLNISHPLAVIVFFLFLFYPLSFLHATEYYALRLAGSDCLLCHVDSGTGSLNRKGTLFQEEGYRYPISWEGILFYFVWGLTVSLILFGLYRRYRLWHLGKAEEKWSQWKERWRGLLIYGFRHRTILKSLFPGVSHLLLFWSFTILTVAITTAFQNFFISLLLLSISF